MFKAVVANIKLSLAGGDNISEVIFFGRDKPQEKQQQQHTKTKHSLDILGMI